MRPAGDLEDRKCKVRYNERKMSKELKHLFNKVGDIEAKDIKKLFKQGTKHFFELPKSW